VVELVLKGGPGDEDLARVGEVEEVVDAAIVPRNAEFDAVLIARRCGGLETVLVWLLGELGVSARCARPQGLASRVDGDVKSLMLKQRDHRLVILQVEEGFKVEVDLDLAVRAEDRSPADNPECTPI
jgi:hypothetical protein